MKYHPAPQVVVSRRPPQWFSDRLREIDPALRMEWWNPHPVMGPTWRLIRVLGDGRWAHVEWLKYEDQMRQIPQWLIENDTHRHGLEPSEVRRSVFKNTMKQIEQEREASDERLAENAYATGEDILRAKESRWRNNTHDKIMSIPGVNSRKNWNS